MSETGTGKISEALQLAIQTINLVNTENGVPYDELEQIRAALLLAEKLEVEVVSLRAELEQAHKYLDAGTHTYSREESGPDKHGGMGCLAYRIHNALKAESPDLRAQVEQLTADKARLLSVLKEHHDWHNKFEVVECMPFPLDLADAYADSSLCERTIDAMKESQ